MSSSPRAARKWMPEEDQRLRNILANIEPGVDINWHHVASHISGRNNKECRKRWIYALMPTLRKGPWNEQEDALLLKGVQLHGLKWPLVSQSVRTRQPDQCSRRWHESLNPSINHGRWSLFEDQVLREAVQTYGRRWTEIVERYFPNRTPIAAKKRYAQCFQAKTRLSKTEMRQEQYNTSRPASASPKQLKKEEVDGSPTQVLWCVPDHSQNISILSKMSQHGDGMRHQTDSSLSTPVSSTVTQFASVFEVAPASFTAPNTPHYSPPYSRDGSLGSSSVTDYPIVSEITHSWAPTESQSAYSGSPFMFHETGYFDPTYTFR